MRALVPAMLPVPPACPHRAGAKQCPGAWRRRLSPPSVTDGGCAVPMRPPALRRLSELGLVERYGQRHPHYRLVQPHPAVPEFVALALRLPEPEQALSVVVRSSPAVWYAAAADDEFMIVQFDDAPEPAMAKL